MSAAEAALLPLQHDLVCGYHILDLDGQGSDIAGHMTGRLPGSERFWTHPYGMTFAEVGFGDLHEADFALRVLRGYGEINPTLYIHTQIYRARPDVNAIVHTHPAHAVALGALGRNLEPVNQSGSIFLDDIALFAEYDGIVLRNDEGDAIAEALGPRRALLLKNHGIIAVGKTVREAVVAAVLLELAASIQLKALAAGEPAPLPREAALQAKRFLTSDSLVAHRWRALARAAQRQRPQLIAPEMIG